MFQSRLISYLSAQRLAGTGLADVTQIIVQPPFAQFCAASEGWKQQFEILEYATLSQDGYERARHRALKGCGARVWADFRRPAIRLFVVFNSSGGSARVGPIPAGDRDVVIIALPRTKDPARFARRARQTVETFSIE